MGKVRLVKWLNCGADGKSFSKSFFIFTIFALLQLSAVKDIALAKMEQLRERVESLILVFPILAIPFVPKWGNYAIMLALFVAIVTRIAKKNFRFYPANVCYGLLAMFAVRIIWIVGAHDFRYALKTIESEFPIFAFALACLLGLFDVHCNRPIKFTYAVLSLMTMLYAFLNFIIAVYFKLDLSFLEGVNSILHDTKQISQAYMLTWRFAHPTFLSLFALYGLVILYFLNDKRTADWIFFLFYLAVTVIFTRIAGSRIGFLLTIGVIVLMMMSELRWFVKPKILIPISVLICATVFFFAVRFGIGIDTIDAKRSSLITRATNAIIVRPFFGYGTGSAKDVFYNQEWEDVGYHINHPHNQYLTELVQFGVIGSIPLLFFLIASYREGLIKKNWSQLSIIVIFSILMLVESPFNSNKGATPFLIAFFLARNTAGSNNHILMSQTKQWI